MKMLDRRVLNMRQLPHFLPLPEGGETMNQTPEGPNLEMSGETIESSNLPLKANTKLGHVGIMQANRDADLESNATFCINFKKNHSSPPHVFIRTCVC